MLKLEIDVNVKIHGMHELIEAIESLGGLSKHDQLLLDSLLKDSARLARRLARLDAQTPDK